MNKAFTSTCLLTFGVFGATFAPQSARADSWGFAIGGAPRWIEPVYATQPRTVVIPAQYEERTRQVWREPVYEDRRTLVTIPPRMEVRKVPRYVNGRFVGYDRQTVVVESGREEWRTERVLVQPGGWETVVDRVLVQPERTETVYEQVLVTQGYWETAPGISFGYADHDHHDHHDHGGVYVGPRGAVRVRR